MEMRFAIGKNETVLRWRFMVNEVSEIRFSIPGDVPRRALAILNPPQVNVTLEVGIIKVNPDKLALAFILAGN